MKVRQVLGQVFKSSVWPGGLGMGGGREAQEEGDIYTLMTDSRCCMAETQHNTVKQLCSKLKKKKKHAEWLKEIAEHGLTRGMPS